MGMNGKFLSRLEVKIQDLEVRRVVYEKPLKGQLVEIILLVQADSFHR
jgi:hypothetical protein